MDASASLKALVAVACPEHLPAEASARVAHAHSAWSLCRRLTTAWRRSSHILSRPTGRSELKDPTCRGPRPCRTQSRTTVSVEEIDDGKGRAVRAIWTKACWFAAGPQSTGGCGSGYTIDLAELHAFLTAGGQARPRRSHRRCGRQRVPRLCGGHCRRVHRPLPSRGGRGISKASRRA